MRKYIILIFIFIQSIYFSGCNFAGSNFISSHDQSKEKTITVSVIKLPTTLNPVIASAVWDTLVYSQVSEPLLKYDLKTMEPVAGIAKKWDVKDGKVYTFFLNHDVYFSDGKHCTTHDFKYSYEKYLTPESPYSYLLEGILGAKEKLLGNTNDTKGIKVLDDYTLEITLDRQSNNFLSALASETLVVIKKEEVEKLGESFGNGIITGVGPFIISRRTENEIEFLRNDKYYGKKAYIGRVKLIRSKTIHAWEEYKKGKIDLLLFVPDVKTLINDPRYKSYIKLIPDLSSVYITLNLNKEPLKSNHRLREAINYAVNKEYIVDHILNEDYGVVSNAIVPPVFTGRENKTPPTYNLAKARKLLAEAGYPDGEGLQQLNLTYHDRLTQKPLVESVKKNLKAIGIKVKLVPVDESQIAPFVKDVTDIFRLSWGPDYLDIDTYIIPIFYSKGSANFGGYYNKNVDALIEKAQLTTSFYERKNMLIKAEDIALKDYCVIPLYWGHYTIINSPRIRNLQLTPNGYPVFESVIIDE